MATTLTERPISLRETLQTKFDSQAEHSFNHLDRHFNTSKQSYYVSAKGASLGEDLYKIQETEDKISVQFRSWMGTHSLLSLFHSSDFNEIKLTHGDQSSHKHRKYVYKVAMTSGQFSAAKVANSINELVNKNDQAHFFELINYMSDAYAADVLKHLIVLHKGEIHKETNEIFAKVINTRPEIAKRILLDDGMIPDSQDISFSDCFIKQLAIMGRYHNEPVQIESFLLNLLKTTKPVKKAMLLKQLCNYAFNKSGGDEIYKTTATNVLRKHLTSLSKGPRIMTLRILKHMDSNLFQQIRTRIPPNDVDFNNLAFSDLELQQIQMTKEIISGERNMYSLTVITPAPKKVPTLVEQTAPKVTQQVSDSGANQKASQTDKQPKIDENKTSSQKMKIDDNGKESKTAFEFELQTFKIIEEPTDTGSDESSANFTEPSELQVTQAAELKSQPQVSSESTSPVVAKKPSIPRPKPVTNAHITEDVTYHITDKKAFKRLVLMNFYKEQAWGKAKTNEEVESAYMDLVEQGAFREDKVVKNIEKALIKILKRPTSTPGSSSFLLGNLKGSPSEVAQLLFEKYINTETGYFNDVKTTQKWQQDIFKSNNHLCFDAAVLIKTEAMSAIFSSMGIDSYIDVAKESKYGTPKLVTTAQGHWKYKTMIERQVLGITYTLSKEEMAELEAQSARGWKEHHKAELQKAGFTEERMPRIKASIDLAVKPYLPKDTNLSTRIHLRNMILSRMMRKYSATCDDGIILDALVEYHITPFTATKMANNINKVLTEHKPLTEQETLKVVQSTLESEKFNELIPLEEDFSEFCKLVTTVFHLKGIYKDFTAKNLRAFFPFDLKLPSDEVFEKVAAAVEQNIRKEEYSEPKPPAKPTTKPYLTKTSAQALPNASETQHANTNPLLTKEQLRQNIFLSLMHFNKQLRSYLPSEKLGQYSKNIAELYHWEGSFQALTVEMLKMAYDKASYPLPPDELLQQIADYAYSKIHAIQGTPLDHPAKPIVAENPQPNAPQRYPVREGGESFARSVLAIELKDPFWCQDASKEQIMQHPKAQKLLNEKTRSAINSAVKLMDEKMPKTHEALAHIAEHLEVQPDDLANAIYEACYANGSFALNSPQSMALQLLPPHLQNNSVIFGHLTTLADTINAKLRTEFNIPVVTPQTRNIPQLLQRHGAVIITRNGKQFNVLTKNQYFGRHS